MKEKLTRVAVLPASKSHIHEFYTCRQFTYNVYLSAYMLEPVKDVEGGS